MKTLIISHTDLDGVGCYIVLEYFKIEYDKILFTDYTDLEKEEWLNEVCEYDKIIFTDFSPTKKVWDKLVELNKAIIILDHHESSKWLMDEKYSNLVIIHDETKSGAEIVYDFYRGRTRQRKIMNQFVLLVGTYDLYKEESPLWEDAQNMNRVLYQCLSWQDDNKYKFISEYWLNKINRYDEWKWSDFELQKIERALQVEKEEYMKAKLVMKIREDTQGNKYILTVASRKLSIIANMMLKEFPQVQYCAIINSYDKKWDKISLRSRRGEFDTTQIGKGHKAASGLEIDPKEAMKLYRGLRNLEYKEK